MLIGWAILALGLVGTAVMGWQDGAPSAPEEGQG